MRRKYNLTPGSMKPGPKPKRFQVRVKDYDGSHLSEWLDCEHLGDGKFFITSPSAFKGATMTRSELEVRKVST